MHAENLTPSTQDYLKAIWLAQEWSEEPITTTGLAARLGFSPSTVSEALKKLTAQGMVVRPRYGEVELTDEGRSAAVEMVRKHRIIETFLTQRLGYGWDEVHDEAEVLEHAVSDRFIERLGALLGDPRLDPHGDAIPDSDGTVLDRDILRLADCPGGSTVRVSRVSDADPLLLRYLSEQGIELGVRMLVGSQHRYAGTLPVQCEGRHLDIGPLAAEAIWVAVEKEPSGDRAADGTGEQDGAGQA